MEQSEKDLIKRDSSKWGIDIKNPEERGKLIKLFLLTLCGVLLFSAFLALDYIGGVYYPSHLSYWERVRFSWNELYVYGAIRNISSACTPYNILWTYITMSRLNQMMWVLLVALLPALHPWLFFSIFMVLSIPLGVNWRLTLSWLGNTIAVILLLLIVVPIFLYLFFAT